RAGGAGYACLTAELALDADLACDGRDLIGEGRERVDHAVDGVGERRDLALRLDGELAVELAFGHGGHDLGDAAHLVGQVGGHEVHVVGQVLPGARYALHLGLPAELAVGADLAGHARDLGGEGAQLIHHRVDRVLELQDLALHVLRDFLRVFAFGHGGHDLGDVAHLVGQVGGHEVHAVGEVLPRARDAGNARLPAELALRADLAGHARHFRGERAQLIDHRVDDVLDLEDLAPHVDGDLLRQVAARDRGRDLRHVAQLHREVARHPARPVSDLLPRARYAADVRLPAEPAFRAHFPGDARHLGGEGPELIDHRVDRVLELEDLAPHVDRDLLREVAGGDGRGHLRDIAHLGGEVGRHRVHAFGEVLPRAGDAAHVGLAAELPLRSHLAHDARHLGGEGPELLDHPVDGLRGPQELPVQGPAVEIEGHALRQVALGDGPDHARHLARRVDQIADQGVDRLQRGDPGAREMRQRGALLDPALLAEHRRHAAELPGHAPVDVHDVVDRVGDLSGDAGPLEGEPWREVPVAERGENFEQLP